MRNGTGTVRKVAASAGYTGAASTVYSQNGPIHIAFDPGGNIFSADFRANCLGQCITIPCMQKAIGTREQGHL
jgi:hypothetical protein